MIDLSLFDRSFVPVEISATQFGCTVAIQKNISLSSSINLKIRTKFHWMTFPSRIEERQRSQTVLSNGEKMKRRGEMHWTDQPSRSIGICSGFINERSVAEFIVSPIDDPLKWCPDP